MNISWRNRRAWWSIPNLLCAGVVLVGSVVVLQIMYEKAMETDRLSNAALTHPTPTVTKQTLLTPTPSPTVTAKSLLLNTPSTHQAARQSVGATTTITFTPKTKGARYDEQKAAVNIITSQAHKAFKDNDSQTLYNLFSSQLTSVFTADNLAEAFGAKGEVDLEPIGEPTISTEWAKQSVSYTSNGTTSQYDMILHLENGEWKLFGTMDAAPQQ